MAAQIFGPDGIVVQDASGNDRIKLYVDLNGSPKIEIYDEFGVERACLAKDPPSGKYVVRLYDATGTPCWARKE